MTCPAETPDGFNGALLALESFRDTLVILHGPTGCRVPNALLSERLFPRLDRRERINYLDPWFHGLSRLPTTHLDGHDMVFGAREKLVAALAELGARHAGVLAIVNSPGAALVADDLAGCVREALAGRRAAIVESPACSRPWAEGYQQGLLAYLDSQFAESDGKPETEPGTVALVGLSIDQVDWEGSVEELGRMLGLCGFRLVCALGAGADLAACAALRRAQVVAMAHSGLASGLMPWLEAHAAGTIVRPASGAPIGFAASEDWVKAVCAAAAKDPEPALADSRTLRRRAAQNLEFCLGPVDSLRGSTFAIQAPPDTARPLKRMLVEYLGMAEAGKSAADLVLGPGPAVAAARMAGGKGIELSLSVEPVPAFLPEPLLGSRGAVRLIEKVVRELFG